jgi:hypothetical protein
VSTSKQCCCGSLPLFGVAVRVDIFSMDFFPLGIQDIFGRILVNQAPADVSTQGILKFRLQAADNFTNLVFITIDLESPKCPRFLPISVLYEKDQR